MTSKQIEDSGFDLYFVNHTAGVYPQDSAGVPFSASTIAVSGDTKVTLDQLRANGIVGKTAGPRPFNQISKEQFETIYKLGMEV